MMLSLAGLQLLFDSINQLVTSPTKTEVVIFNDTGTWMGGNQVLPPSASFKTLA